MGHCVGVFHDRSTPGSERRSLRSLHRRLSSSARRPRGDGCRNTVSCNHGTRSTSRSRFGDAAIDARAERGSESPTTNDSSPRRYDLDRSPASRRKDQDGSFRAGRSEGQHGGCPSVRNRSLSALCPRAIPSVAVRRDQPEPVLLAKAADLTPLFRAQRAIVSGYPSTLCHSTSREPALQPCDHQSDGSTRTVEYKPTWAPVLSTQSSDPNGPMGEDGRLPECSGMFPLELERPRRDNSAADVPLRDELATAIDEERHHARPCADRGRCESARPL